MKTLEQKIILALHPECNTWEEAVYIEWGIETDGNANYIELSSYKGLPISLPRVMQALNHKIDYIEFEYQGGYLTMEDQDSEEYIFVTWKLTDKNGKDLNLEDQSEETREALSKLFNV